MQLHCADCLGVMPELPEASVSAIIADPPYRLTRLAQDRQPVDWLRWWPLARRVLRPCGLVVLFAQQPFTTELILSNREWFRYGLIWSKPRGGRPFDARVRPLAAHEEILIFAPTLEGTTYHPQMRPGQRYRRQASTGGMGGVYGGSTALPAQEMEGRFPISVLEFPRDPDGSGVQKPVALMRWLVASYTDPGDTVLDPFMGRGSTGVACAVMGRAFIGCEIDRIEFGLATERLQGLTV